MISSLACGKEGTDGAAGQPASIKCSVVEKTSIFEDVLADIRMHIIDDDTSWHIIILIMLPADHRRDSRNQLFLLEASCH